MSADAKTNRESLAAFTEQRVSALIAEYCNVDLADVDQ